MAVKEFLRRRWWLLLIIPLFLAAVVETAYFGWKAINVEGPPTAALSLDLSGAGSVSPKAGTHALEKDKLVIVEARPKKGWVFSHWEGPVADGRVPRTTVTMDQDVAVKAVFVEEEPGFYTYKIKTWGAGKVYPEAGLQEFLPEDAGSVVPVQAVPGRGHIFDRWTLNGMEVGREALYRFALADGAELIAHFKPFYTVSVDAGKGGRASGPAGRLEKGEQVKVEALSEPGYIFSEWIEDGKAISNSPTYVFKVEEDRHLTARFLPVYELSVSSTKGGRASASRAWAAAGTGVRVTARPDPGYAFLRWTEGGKKAASGIDLGFLFIPLSYVNTSDYRFTLEKDRHLVAEFAPVYPIKVSVAGNRGGRVATTARNAVKGQRVTVTAVPDKGYLFDRWTEGSREYSGEVRTIKVDRKHRLTAHFVRACQVDTAVEPAGSAGQVWGGGAYKKGENVILRALAVKAAEGEKEHYFAGWYENGKKIDTGEEEAVLRFAANKDRRITARFEPYIAVSAAASPEGSGRVYGAGLYKKGETAALKAVAGPGYEFEHWLDRGGAVAGEKTRLGITAEKDSHYEAVFKKVEQYTVELSSSLPGAGHVSGGGTFNEGTPVTVFAIPKVSHRFANWTEGGSTVSDKMEYSFELDRDYQLVANFIKRFYLGLRAEPEEGGQVQSRGYFGAGAEVEVKAIPSYGFRFDRWMENGELYGEEDCFDLTVERSYNLVGHFVKAHSVSISFDEFAGGSFTGEGLHDVGAPVTVAAEPDENYVFVKWLKDGVTVCDEQEYTFTMPDEPVNLVALFLPLYNIEVNASPAEGGTASVEDRRFVRGEQVTVEAEANEGYDFYRWEENGEPVHASAIYTFTAEKDRTLTAVFRALRRITLEASPESDGTVSANWKYPDYKHPQGEKITVTAIPKTDYKFIKWTVNGETVWHEPEYQFTVGGSDLHLVAHFERKPQYEITVAADPSNWGTVTGEGTYEEDDYVTVTATPSDQLYEFVNWTEDGVEVSQNPTYQFYADKDRNLVANFRIKQYNVTVNVNNTSRGDVQITSPAEWSKGWGTSHLLTGVPHGTVLRLEARESGNNTWDKWSDGVTDKARDYEVKATATITANFNSKGTSCPFVHSYAEDGIHFENEAISQYRSKALENTYYGSLHKLEEVDGCYRVRITEELEEKSFINQFQLFAVDYPADSGIDGVIADIYGNPHTIREKQPPLSFVDSDGRSWLEEIKTEGALIQSDYHDFYSGQPAVAYEAEFKLDGRKPSQAKLIITAGTGQIGIAPLCWEWFMDAVDGKNNQWWIDEILNRDPFKEQFIKFTDIVAIRVELWDGGKWEPQGLLRTGDLLQEYLIPIDLSAIAETEENVKIRIKYGSGFFVIDQLAIDFSENEISSVKELTPSSAVFNGEKDVLQKLSDCDNGLRVRLLPGEAVDLTYDAPELNENRGRGFMAFLNGYYHTHPKAVENPAVNYWDELTTSEIITRVIKTAPGAVRAIPELAKMYRLMASVENLPFEEKVERIFLEHVLPWAEQREGEL